jgi:hypothetical protein
MATSVSITSYTTAQLQGFLNSALTVNLNNGSWMVDLSSTPLQMTITVVAASGSAAITAVTPGILGQASDAPVTVNRAAIITNLTNQLTTIETWITNNPSGAVLTAAQTLTVARMLAGLTRIAIAALSSVGGS